MRRAGRHLARGALGLATLMLGVHVFTHLAVQWQIDRQMGFSYATPVLHGVEEIFVITEVMAGGAMDAAGLEVGDCVCYYSVDDLYHLIAFGQDRTVLIPIQRGARQMAVSVAVPKLDLTIPPGWLWWNLDGRTRTYRGTG
jgi:hypothetical protein